MSAGLRVDLTAVEVTVRGRVQGVCFRDGAQDEAERLGVSGWVSNEPDGTVSAHVEGLPDAVDAMVAWCHDGPPRARVQAVDVRSGVPEGLDSFTVR